MEATYLMSIPRPVEGGCDSSPDFRAELETMVGMVRGTAQAGAREAKVPTLRPASDHSRIAKRRSNFRGAKGASDLCRHLLGSTGKTGGTGRFRKRGAAWDGWPGPDESGGSSLDR